jgi:hypothetical protein
LATDSTQNRNAAQMLNILMALGGLENNLNMVAGLDSDNV